ncbi:winged helix-turn-helix transcriptional regulator [Pseudomonas sp. S31]|uniref:MarR family winged helix-turn-helix transcriptional regulator n=1 Tax=Pseudomonas sp. S31 TaxID=1564473 RepID=UPI001914265B|nr:MarR family winged helix-turn-helix transcriptional regulator [Pseudomonas sp. S31]MBK5002584.1 winged helix-turn-helix transcriptional regulator [Pseudomonas sp. S31]
MSTEPQLDLARYVPALLNFLSNKLSSGASQCYRKHFDIGVVEWRMLSMLAVEDGITANRICQVIGLDKAAVSRSLRALEEAGRVHMAADPADGRRQTVSLSESGRTLHGRVLKVALERERRLLSGLAPEEVDTLIDLLGRLNAQVANVNRYDPDNP